MTPNDKFIAPILIRSTTLEIKEVSFENSDDARRYLAGLAVQWTEQ